MKTSKPNALQVWKQVEDVLVPRLRLSVIDRAVYSHFLRHTRLEGKRRLKFSINSLTRFVQLSDGAIRRSVRRLAANGVLRIIHRSKQGHVIEVRLPNEVRAARPTKADHLRTLDIEHADFLASKPLRDAIHAREAGSCFYCMRRMTPTVKSLDHVIPRVRRGRNSYRNLVSCCLECNTRKGARHAHDFLRWLYRQRHLTPTELSGRLRALDALAAGKLRPRFAAARMPLPRQR